MKYINSNKPPPNFNAPTWEYVGRTPGGGREYCNLSKPAVAIVYRTVTKVYTDIKYLIYKPCPADFKTCTCHERGEK